MTLRFSLLRVAALMTTVLATPAWAQSSVPAGDANRGKHLFVADGCYQCHGYVGQGGGVAGPRIAPAPIAFDAFAKQLREPRNEMPPYGEKILSDKDASDIYAYLQTIPKPPSVKDIVLLNQ